ncbi:MAG: TRAP transporter small permease, partial [Bacteroidales bacterium]|nr:TRAP transporter small permease [Bacteroidales bacterium]
MIKIHHQITKILEVIMVILMSVLVIDVLWQVFSRYLLSSPSSFTDELAGFLLIWVGVLGAAYVAGKKEHLAIDILIQRSPPARQKRLQYIIHSLVFLFALLVMVVGGIILMYTRF